jgi:hypothetical protein
LSPKRSDKLACNNLPHEANQHFQNRLLEQDSLLKGPNSLDHDESKHPYNNCYSLDRYEHFVLLNTLVQELDLSSCKLEFFCHRCQSKLRIRLACTLGRAACL